MTIHEPVRAAPAFSGRDVTAVLGPTNTGKTHLAIERMVARSSGVIGLPLRLLAREVYGRVADKVGVANVALVTGEEKIVPPGARYSVCTVEAMPRETDAAFVAIDEIQLADDLERGHVFTDRILNLRGREETLLLGSSTMAPILQKLLRGLSVVTRPRMSTLAYAGSKKITRLPRRSAIVAFSADEVYAIAELIRRQRGGAAVVLGALSPRTRNSQVELYQSGDVDFLVATDAIGMGLNLDVDHVAFAQARKFDGFQYRDLTPAELAQIAGRAGRHVRDGTFGVTGQVDPFDEELVEKIESHDFQPVRVMQWRSDRLDFSDVEALRRSLDTPPAVEGLTRALPAVDQRALETVLRDGEIRRLTEARGGVERLWDACALPDYRRIAPAEHAELIAAVYADLMKRGHVDEDYMAAEVRRADSTEGDLDQLSRRIAQIRTWTFVSHRPGWLADPTHWQEKTRAIEDALSDALHERLTKRFVDRRTSVLQRRLRENTMIEAEIGPSGTVLVEGHQIGELQGFRFTADQTAGGEDARAVRAAAQKALAQEFETRADKLSASSNHDLALGQDGVLRWIGAPIGTLVAGDDPLRPRVVLLADEQLTGPARNKVAARVDRYVAFQIETHLKPLVDLRNAEALSGIARGLGFRLVESFGSLNRRDVADEVKSLDQDARGALRRLGVRFGAYHIFLPALLKPAPARLATLLFALATDGKDKPGYDDVVHALAAGRTSMAVDTRFDRDFYRLAGFRVLGRRAVRIDILERLADLIRPALSWKPGSGRRPEGGFDGAAFLSTPAMMSILGAKAEDMEEILKNLGYRGEAKPAGEIEAKLGALDTAETERVAAAEAARAEAAVSAAAGQAEREAQGEEPAAEGVEGETAPEAGWQSDATGAMTLADGGETPNEEASEAAVAHGEPASDDSAWQAEVTGAIAPASDVAADAPEQEAGDVAADASANEPQQAEAGSGDAAPEHVEQAEPVDAEPSQAAVPDAAEPAEAEIRTIMVWRPARNEGRFRPQQRQGQRGHGGGRGRQPHAPAGDAAATGDAQARPNRREGGRRFGQSDERGDPRRDGRPPRREGDAPGQRQGRPDRGGHGERGQERRGGGSQERGGQERGRHERPQKPREERPARIDPDSPFAKLAALRDQLKK